MVEGVVTYAEVRRTSIKSRELGRVHLSANTATLERVFVGRIQVLPIVPKLIDHLYNMRVSLPLNETICRTYPVMKEEHRVYVKSVIQHTPITH